MGQFDLLSPNCPFRRLDNAVKGSCPQECVDLWKDFNQVRAVTLRKATDHNKPPALLLFSPRPHLENNINGLFHCRLYETAGAHHDTIRFCLVGNMGVACLQKPANLKKSPNSRQNGLAQVLRESRSCFGFL